jgi:hypothetical protein
LARTIEYFHVTITKHGVAQKFKTLIATCHPIVMIRSVTEGLKQVKAIDKAIVEVSFECFKTGEMFFQMIFSPGIVSQQRTRWSAAE